MMAGQLKGVLLTIASAASVSVTFIASKQAMQQLTPLGFTAPWFAMASLWGVAFYLLRSGPVWPASLKREVTSPQNNSEADNTFQRSAVSHPRSILPAIFWPILLLGFLNGLANYLFFTSINLGDPTLVAFFSRSEVIYTVFLGTWLLGERLRAYQWAGVAIAVTGAGLMTFRAGAVVWLMLLLTLASNFFLAFSTLVAKKSLSTAPPLVLSIARTVVMGVMLGAIGLAAGQLAWPSPYTWLWLIGGAFFGPFFSYVLFYQALQYLDISKSAVIRSFQPFFVAIYSFIIFGAAMTPQQFAGGLLMVAGVVLMLWERK